jgi:ribosomal protein S18 acetylase RimI-like enzyme
MKKATFVDASIEREGEIISLLTNSFLSDPLMRFLSRKQGHSYGEQINCLFRIILDRAKKKNHKLIGMKLGDELIGVVFIQAKEEGIFSEFNNLVKIWMKLGTASLLRFVKYFFFVRRKGPKDASYIYCLAIRESYQGKGYGSQLLTYAHKQMNSKTVYLDTENEKNLPFYNRIGYKLILKKKMSKMNIYVFMLNL